MATAAERKPLLIGWEAAKANAIPALVLQLAMLFLVIAYYMHPPTARVLTTLAEMRQEYGIGFVIVASALAGAVLPELFVIFVFEHGKPTRKNLRNLTFNTPFWVVDGILVDLMYRTLAVWFGTNPTWSTITAKLCVDQFGYNPIFAAPYGIWGYAWKNSGYSWQRLRRLLTWRYYREKAVPVLVATWAVWVPLMAVIYALPLSLQFPLFALALAFWVLMMTYMTNRFAETHRAEEPPPVAVVPPLTTTAE